MKRLLLATATIAALTFANAASADTYVRGYTRSDGTYVAPHFRSNPNGTTLDNWSTKGNTNPYTGKAGTVDPFNSGSSSFGSSSYGLKSWGSGSGYR